MDPEDNAQNRGDQPASELIAVVDDDASFRRSVGRLLRSVGYAVETFGSARQFLSSLPKPSLRCLVLDVHMPEMTGLDLQAHLLAQGFSAPVIFVTAFDTPQTRERARQAGSLDLLVKPFNMETFLGAIREALAWQPKRADEPAEGQPAEDP